jgi:hypothetical protein
MTRKKTTGLYFTMILLFIIGCSSGEWDAPTNETSDPFVISVIPPRGADGVVTNENIVAFFSRDMNSSTITMGNYYVLDYNEYVSATVGTSDGTVTTYGVMPPNVPGNYSYDANQRAAIFSPRYLYPDTQYIAFVSTGVKASNGRNMLTGYSWTFSTKTQSRSSMP